MKLKNKSETYRKAYEQANRICTTMPHELKNMYRPEGEDPEYTKGFEDRVRIHEIETDAANGYSYQKLFEKYGQHLISYETNRAKGMTKSK